MTQATPSGSPFTSAEAFLRAAQASKANQLSGIEEKLSPIIDAPHAFSVPYELHKTIEALVDEHGDEALKAIVMFCLGKWHQHHMEMLQQNCEEENYESALWTMGDSAKLGLLMENIAYLGSFSGDESWKAMLKKSVARAVADHYEEYNLPLDTFLQENHDQG